MSLNKQIWINHILNNFYPQTSFLNFTTDFSALVEYDKLHLAEVGVDPEVLINNTTYPIAVSKRDDTPLEIELDLFETTNTLIREPEAVEYAFDKTTSVIYGHQQTLRTATAKKAAHAFAPTKDSEFTPVISTSGATDDGFKKLTIADILKLKRRFDALDYPTDERYLVLDPKHTEDLILEDTKSFKDITDLVNGVPKRFAGFNILEFTKNPKYDSTTLEKIPFGGIDTNASVCSFAFCKSEVMKADGTMKMYDTLHDPKERATIIGFDKRFIALPIRNKGIGAIVSTKA